MTHAGTALIDPHLILDKLTLAEGARVADLGCGRTGHLIFPVSRLVGERGVVYAVDILKEVLENIKSRCRSEGFDNIQAVWSDIEQVGKTPIPAQSLDACLIINVLFQVKQATAVLKEAARLLKAGGRLVVVDWKKKLGPLGPGPETMIKPEFVSQTGVSCGLRLLENYSLSDYHFCLIFKKE